MSKPEVKYETLTTVQNEFTMKKFKRLCEYFNESEDEVIERAIKKLYYELWKEINNYD